MNDIPAEAYDWIYDALLFSLVVGLLVALLVGVWLFVHPVSLFAVNTRTSRWLSLRRALKPVEVPVRWERRFYHHHRLFGSIVLAAAGFCLWRWLVAYERARVMHYLGEDAWVHYGWLLGASEVIFVGLNVLLLPVGLILIFRPSLLKSIETWSNRWVSTRQATRPMERQHDLVDQTAWLHPRVVGAVIAVVALYALLILLPAMG